MKVSRFSITKLSGVILLLAAAACAEDGSATAVPSTATIDQQGVSPAALSLTAGSALRFKNGDQRPHQIYSSDCRELSTTLLLPGDEFDAQVGVGPKVCHFQDMLAPTDAQYFGTIEVTASPSNLDPSDHA
jgi:plastocyanin